MGQSMTMLWRDMPPGISSIVTEYGVPKACAHGEGSDAIIDGHGHDEFPCLFHACAQSNASSWQVLANKVADSMVADTSGFFDKPRPNIECLAEFVPPCLRNSDRIGQLRIAATPSTPFELYAVAAELQAVVKLYTSGHSDDINTPWRSVLTVSPRPPFESRAYSTVELNLACAQVVPLERNKLAAHGGLIELIEHPAKGVGHITLKLNQK